eukprot:1396877-Alexandrium_andersonii.AAC.1
MSASLVGSEMCIRDRRGPRPPSSQLRARSRRRRASFGASGSQRGILRACLLYTSDAADDM